MNIDGISSTRATYIKFSRNRSNVDDTTSIWRMAKVRKQCLCYCFGTIIISNETFFCRFILNKKTVQEGWIDLCKIGNKYIKIKFEHSKTVQVRANTIFTMHVERHPSYPTFIYLVHNLEQLFCIILFFNEVLGYIWNYGKR